MGVYIGLFLCTKTSTLFGKGEIAMNEFKKKQLEKQYEKFYGKYWETLAKQQNEEKEKQNA
jgi:hypothetical protein